MKLAASILAADFSNLMAGISQVEEAGAHLLHIDVMDGHFVPNISYGPPLLKSLQNKTQIPFDVHLMIENPDRFIQNFAVENTTCITVHEEARGHLHRVIQQIKSFGKKAGVALNPSTPLTALDWILEDIDVVLLMSVNPGFGGQKFIPSSLEKARALKTEIKRRKLAVEIQMDGGITLENLAVAAEAGVDVAVAGTAIFRSENICERTKQFLDKCKEI